MSMKTWTQFTRTLPKKINLNEVQNQSEANCIVLLISNHFSNSKIKEFHQYIYNQFNGKSLIGAVVDSVGAPGYSLTACHGIGFYSKPGRIQKQKAVGRWPSMFNQPMVDNPIFKTISLKAQNVNQDVLPNNSLSSNPSLLLTFSDNEPYDLYDHFQSQYPDSIKMGLVASRTPFLNGNPYTLFYNDQTISNGCVGLSTTDKVNFSYNDSIFQPLHDDYLTISKSQGNIILQIEGSDASRLLVEKVSTQIQPHSDFNLYIRIKSQTNQEMIFSIIGGDLSKGTLAIETLSDLTPGMKIQVSNSHELTISL
ncbi:hypothetical protein BC833DRAFT_604447 [Globomyces pollinis-pini]|nr:hypothetical protein BC833DRAFT_604447 [Globomyces pollinis-pini]